MLQPDFKCLFRPPTLVLCAFVFTAILLNNPASSDDSPDYEDSISYRNNSKKTSPDILTTNLPDLSSSSISADSKLSKSTDSSSVSEPPQVETNTLSEDHLSKMNSSPVKKNINETKIEPETSSPSIDPEHGLSAADKDPYPLIHSTINPSKTGSVEADPSPTDGPQGRSILASTTKSDLLRASPLRTTLPPSSAPAISLTEATKVAATSASQTSPSPITVSTTEINFGPPSTTAPAFTKPTKRREDSNISHSTREPASSSSTETAPEKGPLGKTSSSGSSTKISDDSLAYSTAKPYEPSSIDLAQVDSHTESVVDATTTEKPELKSSHNLDVLGSSRAELSDHYSSEFDGGTKNLHGSSRHPKNESNETQGVHIGLGSDIAPENLAEKGHPNEDLKNLKREGQNDTALFQSRNVTLNLKAINYFLQNHIALPVQDARAYLTDEKTSRALAILKKDICNFPEKIRFAYLLSVFSEIGRKIASKLNYYSSELISTLGKAGSESRPEASMLLDVITNVFDSKNDENGSDDNGLTIADIVKADRYKGQIFELAVQEISSRFGHLLANFAVSSTKSCIQLTSEHLNDAAKLMSESLQWGAIHLLNEMSTSDKFRADSYTQDTARRILNITTQVLAKQIMNGNETIIGPIDLEVEENFPLSYHDLGELSDDKALIGPWTSYMFTNLGSSERVIKVFSGLLRRAPKSAKARVINAYISSVGLQIEATLSDFVSLQALPQMLNENSQVKLLDPRRLIESDLGTDEAKFRDNFLDHKNRLSARCYLAGRRWRLMMMQGLKGYKEGDEIVKNLADRIDKIKAEKLKSSTNELIRLCLPRLVVGLRGLGIDGNVQLDNDDLKNKNFPFRSPIEGLNSNEHPFFSGYKFGYKIGFKIAYNEDRNATLEIEATSNDSKKQNRIDQVTKISWRKATKAAAISVFPMCILEGYLTSLNMRLESGLTLQGKAGSKDCSLRGRALGGEVGKEIGRQVANEFFLSNKKIHEREQDKLIKLGEASGESAGLDMGELLGSIVGMQAAEEAFKHRLVRGSKLRIVKFHIDEYMLGANAGLEFGLKEGKRVSSSSTLDLSAPKVLKFSIGRKVNSRLDSDIWEKDLIPFLNREHFQKVRELQNDTKITGSISGVYSGTRFIHSNLDDPGRMMEDTYKLAISITGYERENLVYLSLNGTVDNVGKLSGLIISEIS